MVPAIIFIICAGIYGLFELFVRKQERLKIIDKIGEKLDASAFEGTLRFPGYPRLYSFSALKAGCLLVGIGLGLLVGFFISRSYAADLNNYREQGVLYGSSVLLFGGIALIIAFFIEMKKSRENARGMNSKE